MMLVKSGKRARMWDFSVIKSLKFKEISQSSPLGCKILYVNVRLLVQHFFLYLFLYLLLTFAEPMTFISLR